MKMALIKKNVLLCNKCNKESEADPNVIILGEEFYLCDDCLERLVQWITTKPDLIEFEKKEITHKRPKTYFQWDDYNIRKMIGMINDRMTRQEIADKFCVTKGAIAHIINRINLAKPGSTLYQYQKCFEARKDPYELVE